MAIVAVSLFFLSGALGPVLYAPDREVLRRAFILSLYSLSGALLLPRSAMVIGALRRAWPILLPVGLAIASIGWSASAPLTQMWVVGLIGTTALGLLLCTFSLDEQVGLLAAVLGVAALASVVAVLVAPGVGNMGSDSPGALKGVFSHKNLLGRNMVLAASALFLMARESKAGLLHSLTGPAALLSVALVIGSRSVSAMILLAVSANVVGVLFWERQAWLSRRPPKIILVSLPILAVVVLLSVAAITPRDLLALVGKDPTITGRSQVWTAVLEAVRLHPWLGYGYAAFWRGAEIQDPLIRAIPWHPEHAHNGFLDLALDLGLLGVASFVLPFGVFLWRAASVALKPGPPTRVWPLLLLVTILLGNLVESSLLRANRLDWALYVATAVSVSKTPRRSPYPSSVARRS